MTNEEVINFGEMWLDMNEDAKDSQTYEFFETALETLKTEPCEDAVSREAVLEITAETGAVETQARVKALPSVISKQKTGKWILTIEDWNKWTCSKCGFYHRTDIHVTLGWNFCPHCGAEMERGD